ncbi:transglycosylase SLT domain-containing protein [Onishia niordana]|uniref:transglycosylase SLT domain-containing protein n=1 Tax=Onishia niordana TaxID=2508711 RepID=UPI001F1067DD|nr:transglycosylase SLT domain-containing protein [Halomonas niordiana]
MLVGAMLLPTATMARTSLGSGYSAPLHQTLEGVLDTPRAAIDFWTDRQWRSAMAAPLSRFVDDPERRALLLDTIQQEARLAGLAPGIVMAVIQVESAFQTHAVSSAGARGLMQVMPFWVEALGRPDDDLFDPLLNLRYGCTILAHYLAVEDGDLTRALARYNGSRGETWYPERVMRTWRQRWWIAP